MPLVHPPEVWERAAAMWRKGVMAGDICDATGLSFWTLISRAQRHRDEFPARTEYSDRPIRAERAGRPRKHVRTRPPVDRGPRPRMWRCEECCQVNTTGYRCNRCGPLPERRSA